jgi:hypothetical protein
VRHHHVNAVDDVGCEVPPASGSNIGSATKKIRSSLAHRDIRCSGR